MTRSAKNKFLILPVPKFALRSKIRIGTPLRPINLLRHFLRMCSFRRRSLRTCFLVGCGWLISVFLMPSASIQFASGIGPNTSGYFPEQGPVPPVRSPLCQRRYKADVIKVDINQQKLGDFIRHLNDAYQANIALDPKLYGLEIRMFQVSGKWTTLLKVIMEQEKLDKTCYNGVASITRKDR
jgi:hypothetical protein